MKKIHQSPILFSFFFVLGIVLIHKIPVFALFEALGFTKTESDLIDKIILNGIIIVITVFLIKKLDLDSYAGLDFRTWQNPHFYPIMILYLLIFTNGFRAFTTIKANENIVIFVVGLFLLKSITIGVLEEIVFRGLIQSIIVRHVQNEKKNIFMGVVLASVIFGLAHIINLDNPNYTFQGVISQIFAATCLGTLFGTILLRTRNIYPIILIHSLISFFSLIGTLFPNYFVSDSRVQTSTETVVSLIFTGVLFGSAFIIAVFLMKNFKVEKENVNF